MMSASNNFSATIDHVGLVGRNIGAMALSYERLGFAPTNPVQLMSKQRGVRVALGQCSSHIVFANSYLELSSITSKSPGHHLAPWLAIREGLHILALGTSNAEARRAEVIASGLKVTPVQIASRDVRYGKNLGEARFHWFKAPDELSEEGFVCFVEQATPDLVFQPPLGGHPNGALDVMGVTILASDAQAAQQRYAKLLGLKLKNHDGLVNVECEHIDIFDSASLTQAFYNMKSIEPPALAGFTVGVANLQRTRSWLESAGINIHANIDGAAWIDPDDACGSLVIFKQI